MSVCVDVKSLELENIRRARVTALAALLLSLTVPAMAQNDTAPIETVIVTAEKRAEPANKIGMSIAAASGAELRAQRVTNIQDLGTVVPSFTASQGYEGVPIYSLRGIGFNTINLSATSTVGTYVDEVAYAYPFMMAGPVFDVQRVEVLKGPQGTLYGRNTTAGLIDFITNKPSDAYAASLTAEIGNNTTHNFEGFVTGPLTDSLNGRFAFRTEDSDDGWQISNTRPGDRQGEKHNYAARGELAWHPQENLTVALTLNGWIDKSDTVAAQAIGLSAANQCPNLGCYLQTPGLIDYLKSNQPTRGSQADWEPATQRGTDIGSGTGIAQPLRENDDFYSAVVRTDYSINDAMTLVSLTSYNHIRRNAVTDWSGAPYELFSQNESGHVSSFSQEVRLQGDSGDSHWIAGAYYGNDSILDSARTLFGQNSSAEKLRLVGLQILANPFANFVYNSAGYTPLEMLQGFRTYSDFGRVNSNTWSLFANEDWQFAPNFKLTGGLRYTRDRQSFKGCSTDFNGNALPIVNVVDRYLYTSAAGIPDPIAEGGCATFNSAFTEAYGIPARQFGLIHSKLDEDNLAGRAGLDWTPMENTLVYASVSRGFKSGDIPILSANTAVQERPAKQEQVLAYETGIKTLLADGRVQLNFAGFYYDYYDKQLRVLFADPIYGVLSRLDNIPRAHAYGIDTDATWAITEELTASATATYVQTYLGDYVGASNTGGSQQYRGAHFPLSPAWQGAVTLAYARPVGDNLGFEALLNEHLQEKSCSDLCTDPTLHINGYALLNASVGLHSLDNMWRVAVWARNLTNAYYWTLATGNTDVNVRFPGQTRTYGVSLTYNLN